MQRKLVKKIVVWLGEQAYLDNSTYYVANDPVSLVGLGRVDKVLDGVDRLSAAQRARDP
jgi:hypothetical protein